MITEKEATELWDQCRDAFQNAEKILIKIIQTEAWVPLGYSDFATAWRERMQGIRLTNELRAHVVYQMLNEGLSHEEISVTAHVGMRAVADIAEKKSRGYTAVGASIVRQHMRNKPNLAHVIRVEVTPEERLKFQEMCRERGTTLELEAETAIREHFESMLSAV